MDLSLLKSTKQVFFSCAPEGAQSELRGKLGLGIGPRQRPLLVTAQGLSY
jgi:hypothetical protein